MNQSSIAWLIHGWDDTPFIIGVDDASEIITNWHSFRVPTASANSEHLIVHNSKPVPVISITGAGYDEAIAMVIARSAPFSANCVSSIAFPIQSYPERITVRDSDARVWSDKSQSVIPSVWIATAVEIDERIVPILDVRRILMPC